jgi:hypothetical protein
MIGFRLAGFVLCIASGTAYAQPATESKVGLESCVEAARLADSICAKLPLALTEREGCLKKGGAALLKCLEQVLPDPPGPTATQSPPRVNTQPPESSSSLSALKEPGPADSLGAATSGAPADAIAGKPKAPASEANIIPRPAEAPAIPRPAEAPAIPRPAEAPAIPRPAEAPSAATAARVLSKQDERPARKTDWTLSETRSPVDFSPLVIAVIRATSDVKDGPNSFEVRCRSQRTEISIRADGAWTAQRGNELVVDYQINDQPIVRQPWILSADGKTATYRNDSVELLRSLPDGGTMKIALTDKGGVRHESIFHLTGLSRVRESVGTACKFPPTTAKSSSDRR